MFDKTTKTRAGLYEERGVALFMVLSYMLVGTVFLGAFMQSLRFTLERQRDSSRQLVLQNLAQAGIDSAIAHLQFDADGYAGEENVPLGVGEYSVRVEREDGSGAYRVTARGELTAGAPVIHAYELEARVVVRGGRLVSLTQRPVRANREET